MCSTVLEFSSVLVLYLAVGFVQAIKDADTSKLKISFFIFGFFLNIKTSLITIKKKVINLEF